MFFTSMGKYVSTVCFVIENLLQLSIDGQVSLRENRWKGISTNIDKSINEDKLNMIEKNGQGKSVNEKLSKGKLEE